MFDGGVVYTLSFGLFPNFIEYSDPAKPPCVRFAPRQGFSEAEFLKALSSARAVRYDTTIDVSDLAGGASVSAASYVTVNAYDLQAMYQAVVGREGGRCRAGASR